MDIDDEDELILNPNPRKDQVSPKEIPFWSEDPNILLNVSQINELFPASDMSYNQKLNSISRMVIILTLVVYFFTKTVRSIIFGVFSMFSIYLVHYYYVLNKKKEDARRDAFTGLDGQNASNDPALFALGSDADALLTPMEVFDQPTAQNPFSNVLITDVTGNPKKKPALPAYNEKVNKTILDAAREAVMNANPDQPDISDKLFKDLGEQLTFEQSMRQFYSNPATLTPDDQQAFAEFCYGSMISCAEGNKFACARNTAAMRHTLT